MELGGQRHASAALPSGKTRYTVYRRLGGPQGQSGRVRKISSPPPPWLHRQTFQPVASRYTDYDLRYPGPHSSINVLQNMRYGYTRQHRNVLRLYAGLSPVSGFALSILNHIALLFKNISFSILCAPDPSGCVGLRPLAWWDCRFECHWAHGCLSLVSIVCYWEESYQVWCVWWWSWILDNVEVLAH